MKTIFALLLIFSSPVISNAKDATAEKCLERRGSIDMGSGSTKALGVVIDVCKKQIKEVIFESQKPIGFNEALKKSASHEIPDALIEEAGTTIGALVKEMKEKQILEISGVATSAFREAKNGIIAAKKISLASGAKLHVITQRKEAELGYLSAISSLQRPVDPKAKTVVWDIGGGSMQMISHNAKGTDIFEGNLASVSFKNRVLQEVQKKDLSASPNPLGTAQDPAVKLAQEHADKNVPQVFKSGSGIKWIGIGGVLAISTQNQVESGAKKFTQETLQSALSRRALLSDEQIDSEYKTTDVTNLALVLGYMKSLKISEVETTKSSLNQGWVLDQLAATKTRKAAK